MIHMNHPSNGVTFMAEFYHTQGCRFLQKNEKYKNNNNSDKMQDKFYLQFLEFRQSRKG